MTVLLTLTVKEWVEFNATRRLVIWLILLITRASRSISVFMKNFSAQSYAHREFSLVEFKSELDALELINKLPSHVKLLDMFTLLNQNIVVFLTCYNRKIVYDLLRAQPSALDGYFTHDTIIEPLKAFYYLDKPLISEALIVLESERLSQIFHMMDAAHQLDLRILDLENQKSH